MKTIIEMAREAGLHRNQHNLASNPVQHRFSYDGYEENLERLIQIVRADEREACLNWCAAYATDDGTAQKIDAAIRARGNT
jgi:effector-binding domain-containing protein